MIERLLAAGALTLDPLGLGYATAANGLALGSRGPVDDLYVLGPACRARDFEHTAVPELRNQAELLAIELLADKARRRRAVPGRPRAGASQTPLGRIAQFLAVLQ